MACLQSGTVYNTNNNNNTYTVTNLHNLTNYDDNNPKRISCHPNNNKVKPLINRNCTVSIKNKYTKDLMETDEERNDNGAALITPTHFSTNESQNNTINEDCDLNFNKSETKNKDVNILNNGPSIDNNENHLSDAESASEINSEGQTDDLSGCGDDENWQKAKNILDIHNQDNMDQIHYNRDNQINKSTYNNDNLEISEPPHHARRPMNAFLIFCKRHRTVVKKKYPHLENRAVTKILGEWWAGLEQDEKACYTNLAQEYKNAFFSANPNFKWYKLPAPPLRTLNTRPANFVKIPTKKTPEHVEEATKQHETLFNPGKLADETQLGNLSSLIGNQIYHNDKPQANLLDYNTENNVNETEKNNYSSLPNDEITLFNQLTPPLSSTSLSLPSKPLKKRFTHQNKDNKSVVRSIFTAKDDSSSSDSGSSLSKQSLTLEDAELGIDFSNKFSSSNNNGDANAVTKQELIEKVVDHICTTSSNDSDECLTCLNKNKHGNETRMSVRSCKGLRYAKFMAEGKLLVNKRSKKHKQNSQQITKTFGSNEEIYQVPRRESIELSETIKKLAERTSKNVNIFPNDTPIYENNNYDTKLNESHEDNMKKMFRAADFNLDEKIEALPSLSLEKFQQKKKESKKKKIIRTFKPNTLTEHKKEELNSKTNENNNTLVTGSRKRKPRKQSITRLDLQNDNVDDVQKQPEVDLFGLATLAEVAAKKAKIDQ